MNLAQHEQLEIVLCSSAASGVQLSLSSDEPHPIVQATTSKLLAVGDVVLASHPCWLHVTK